MSSEKVSGVPSRRCHRLIFRYYYCLSGVRSWGGVVRLWREYTSSLWSTHTCFLLFLTVTLLNLITHILCWAGFPECTLNFCLWLKAIFATSFADVSWQMEWAVWVEQGPITVVSLERAFLQRPHLSSSLRRDGGCVSAWTIGSLTCDQFISKSRTKAAFSPMAFSSAIKSPSSTPVFVHCFRSQSPCTHTFSLLIFPLTL